MISQTRGRMMRNPRKMMKMKSLTIIARLMEPANLQTQQFQKPSQSQASRERKGEVHTKTVSLVLANLRDHSQ